MGGPESRRHKTSWLFILGHFTIRFPLVGGSAPTMRINSVSNQGHSHVWPLRGINEFIGRKRDSAAAVEQHREGVREISERLGWLVKAGGGMGVTFRWSSKQRRKRPGI